MNLTDKDIDFYQGVLWSNLLRISVKDYIQQEGFKKLEDLAKGIPKSEIFFKTKKENNFPNSIKIGVGTYKWNYDISIIKQALKKGCLFIDTAPTYGFGKVEKELSEILKGNKTVLVASKIPKNRMTNLNINNSFNKTKQLFKTAIHYQIHWPNKNFPFSESIQNLVNLKKRLFDSPESFGLCNCSTFQLSEALNITSNIDTLQIPLNPKNTQSLKYLIPTCKKQNIKVIAYSPFGQNLSEILENKQFEFLFFFAKKNNCSIPQFILAWMINQEIIPIPRSNDLKHMEENLDSIHIFLSKNDMEEVNKKLFV